MLAVALGGAEALMLAVVVAVAATILATRRLQRYEIGDAGDSPLLTCVLK
jgi:hypothetical protein